MVMSNRILSRNYLESMVSADLVALADEYGIDVPENLNRRFIIAELLETAMEMDEENESNIVLVKSADLPQAELPKSYNETAVTAILRNPVWLYIYWDISDNDLDVISSTSGCRPALNIVIFDSEHQLVAGDSSRGGVTHECNSSGERQAPSADSFIMPIAIDDREQYVLLPAGKAAACVELVLNMRNGKRQVLAVSSVIPLPWSSLDFSSVVTKKSIPPMLSLSGFHEIIREQYQQHRHSFSQPEK
jgi:hypothetical protein